MIKRNFITSWDDGNVLDMKLFDILKKYNIPAIFFLSTYHPNFTEEDILLDNQIKKIASVYEIGGHTDTHPQDLKLLSKKEQKEDILDNKNWLKSFKNKIDSFCYPSGKYNETTIKVLKELNFKYARTTLTGNTDKPKDSYRIKTTCHIYPKSEKFNKPDFLDNAKKLWEEAISKGDNGYFHLWGHSWEIEKFNMWNDLEEFFKYIQKDKDWWK